MKIVLGLLIGFMCFTVNAQHKTRKKKHSIAEGTLYGYWGYNRSAFTNSSLHFVGPSYDFTIKGASAHDKPTPFDPAIHFNPLKLTLAQYNTRIGYYFRDHYSISFGYDHMKYMFADNNEVYLSGEISPEAGDTVWSGVYNGEQVTTNRSHFRYENSQGLNYLRLELTRSDKWFTAGADQWFALTMNVGVGAGGIVTYNDFLFAGKENTRTVSMSGYGMSVHVGPRFEFFRHVFLQTNLSAGFMHQVKVRTRPKDPSAYARQAYGYASFETVLGFFLYIRPKNGCDSCPVW